LPQRFEQGEEPVGIEQGRIGNFDTDRPAIGGTVNEQHVVDPVGSHRRRTDLPLAWPSSEVAEETGFSAIDKRTARPYDLIEQPAVEIR